MANDTVAKVLVVEIGGTRLPADLANSLVDGYVDDSRTLPDTFVLRFRDPSRVLIGKAGIKIGSEARLLASSGAGGSPKPLLNGEVTALELDFDETGTFTVVRGMDKSHRLFRGRRVAAYQNMTVADICRRVAQRAGLSTGKIDVSGPVLEHVAQANLSDWEFLRDLAEDAGAQVFVIDGALHVTSPTEASDAPGSSARADRDPLVLELGKNLLRCRAGVTASGQVSQVQVRGWDTKTKQALVATADAGRTDAVQLGMAPADAASPFGKADYLVTDNTYGAQARVEQVAKALAQRIAGSFAEMEAAVQGNPEVRAGGAVALSGVGAPFEGRYTVTSSRHVFDAHRGYETWVTVSGQQERSLSALAGGVTGRSGRVPEMDGVVIGVVSDTKDPDKLSRVKVKFPWLSEEYVSDWARCAQTSGGGGKNGKGTSAFVPEVGDEVLVGFEQGRLDRPYVMGCLFNGQDKPATASGELIDGTSGAVNRRTFSSRSGNQLELLDNASGPQGVRMVTGDGKLTIDLDRKGTKIIVHSDGTVEIDAKDKVTVKAGNGALMDAGNGTLELTGKSVKVTAQTGVQVDGGTGQVGLKTSGGVEVKGTQVAVNGTARTEIKGGATCTINAGLVRIN
ncbi:VgrG-related protein [Streptomyces sp. NPDC059766]|uniref:VgrG-related protein n=1 Tax=Streptomyces sp. NPDC059766 TaxID=3346940 RepID=UPI003669EBAD